MDRHGISKVRRAELLARLSALEQQIEAQAARVRQGREMGWNVSLSEQRLGTLRESRDLYRSALRHLLGTEIPEDPGPRA
jgi:uncharacterized protein involved in exopolysaccharide biosynthesis